MDILKTTANIFSYRCTTVSAFSASTVFIMRKYLYLLYNTSLELYYEHHYDLPLIYFHAACRWGWPVRLLFWKSTEADCVVACTLMFDGETSKRKRSPSFSSQRCWAAASGASDWRSQRRNYKCYTGEKKRSYRGESDRTACWGLSWGRSGEPRSCPDRTISAGGQVSSPVLTTSVFRRLPETFPPCRTPIEPIDF